MSQCAAQFLCGAVTVGDEGGIATQPFHQPGRATLAGIEVAGEVHAADHALARIFRRARQQLFTPFRQHVRQ